MSFPVEHATFNHLWAALLLEEAHRLGVREVLIAPGSRSAPLTTAASEHPGLRTHCHFDERGLGFMALGLARASRRPVVVITTSGTAVANLYPAVIEAKLLGVPLILLTADRPVELLDNASNQAIDQRGIFASHTVDDHDLPPPGPEMPAAFLLSTFGQALARQRRTPGPVHLNCRYREPLYPGSAPVDARDYLAPLARWREGTAPWSDWRESEPPPSLESEQVLTSRRGVIVVGRLDDERQAAPIAALSDRLGWPLLADLQSQLHFDARNLTQFDLALHDDAFTAELGRAEVLLQFGARLISKRLTQFIARHAWQDVWLVDALPQRFDPDYTVRRRVVAAPTAFAEALAVGERRPPWHRLDALERPARHWMEARSAHFSELGVCHRLLRRVKGQLVAGNSLSARLLNMLATPRPSPPRVLANRGASGIDGLIATAYGASLAVEAPTTLVMGDTSALHDLNSLALLGRATRPLVVVILNNDGGSIFHLLPVPEAGGLREQYFRQPHGLGFEHAARMFGLGYAAPDSLAAFETAYARALEAGVTLIEVRFEHHQVALELTALGALIREGEGAR